MKSHGRLAVVVLLVAVGFVAAASLLYIRPYETVTHNSLTSTQTSPETVHVISEWKALEIAFGSQRNFTTLPPPYTRQGSANITATLGLVAFWRSKDGNSGGYNTTIIEVDNRTGLPTENLVVYPNGTFESNGECLLYMYIWQIQVYPAPYPHGGAYYIDAMTGQRIDDLRAISFSITCTTASSD